MIGDFAKAYLHDDLRWVRRSLLDKVEGVSEYDARRPLTRTGTNLLGLIKHLTLTIELPLVRDWATAKLPDAPPMRRPPLPKSPTLADGFNPAIHKLTGWTNKAGNRYEASIEQTEGDDGGR